MPDEMDHIQERSLAEERQMLRKHQEQALRAPPRPSAAGYCRNPLCELPFNESDSPRLFCAPACAQEYEKHQPKRGK